MIDCKRIVIEIIPHNEQRYDTVGDYWVEGDTWHIRSSDLGEWRGSYLVALHELVELALITHRGIPEKDVLAFDLAWEKLPKREQGEEPGFHPKAPYFHQHCLADTIERLVAPYLDYWVSDEWEAIDQLPKWKPKRTP